MKRAALLVLLGGCATGEAARTGPVEVEGLVRQREARCGPRSDFVLAVGSKPVAGRRFSVRATDASGAELASIVTSEEGAFRLALRPGRWCFVDTTHPGAARVCAGVLSYQPSAEPIPVVVLPALPCP
ncbi:MAG: hypothetical protein JNJ54_32040 [Myxococcaceae bacterium]|nr:hypothetical protein [Myxococcaceae bacterium]